MNAMTSPCNRSVRSVRSDTTGPAPSIDTGVPVVLISSAEAPGRKRLRCFEKRLTATQAVFLLSRSPVCRDAYACDAARYPEVFISVPFQHETVGGWIDALNSIDDLLAPSPVCGAGRARIEARRAQLLLLAVHMADFFGMHGLLGDLVHATWKTIPAGASTGSACSQIERRMTACHFFNAGLVQRIWAGAPMWAAGYALGVSHEIRWRSNASTHTLMIHADVLHKLPEAAQRECMRILASGISFSVESHDPAVAVLLAEKLVLAGADKFMDCLHTFGGPDHQDIGVDARRYRMHTLDRMLTIQANSGARADEDPRHVLDAIKHGRVMHIKCSGVLLDDAQALASIMSSWPSYNVMAKDLDFHDCASQFSNAIIASAYQLQHVTFTSASHTLAPGSVAGVVRLGKARSAMIIDGLQDVSACTGMQRLHVETADGMVEHATSLPANAQQLEQLQISGSVLPQHAPMLARYTALEHVTIWLSHAIPLAHLMTLQRIRTVKLRILPANANMLLAFFARIAKGGADLVWPLLRTLLVSCGGATEGGTCSLDACRLNMARCSKALSSVRGHAVDVVARCTCWDAGKS